LCPTRDHGYLVAGISNSGISGDKTAPNIGGSDIWLVKLDSLGHKEWDRAYGSTGDDGVRTVDTTLDGGYVMSSSKSYPYGNYITRLDSAGNILWDKMVPSSAATFLSRVYHTSDGGFIVGGGRVQNSREDYDYYVLKLDAMGNTVWERRIFGDRDDALNDIIETSDGGYLVGGTSNSGAGLDKTAPNVGNYNPWLVKLDATGNKLWDKVLRVDGGYQLSLANTADGGFVVATGSRYVGADKTEPSRGGIDYWVAKLTDNGQVQWDKTLGGSDDDDGAKVVEYKKNEYVVGGVPIPAFRVTARYLITVATMTFG
jgi:hypothetical protein